MDIEIQTYWNVETLYYVFNAVASMMAGAGFAGLLIVILKSDTVRAALESVIQEALNTR